MSNSAHPDALAAFDISSIGNEFTGGSKPTLDQRRQHEERRSQLLVDGWKATMTDAESIPRENLRRSRDYETKTAGAQASMTVCVCVVATCIVGFVIAFIIRNLAM